MYGNISRMTSISGNEHMVCGVVLWVRIANLLRPSLTLCPHAGSQLCYITKLYNTNHNALYRLSNIPMHSSSREITERDRRLRLIGWSMRITLDVTLHHYA